MSSFQNSDPARLAKLIDLNAGVEPVGGSDDLGAILAHQLAAPLIDDLKLSSPPGPGPDHVRKLAAAVTPPIVTFGDLFNHPRAPAELLMLVKQFAKKADAQTGGHLPHEVVSVFYFGSITLAITRARVRISELDHAALLKGVTWAEDTRWIQVAMPGFFQNLGESLREVPEIMTLPKL